jgi:hypothetical protein
VQLVLGGGVRVLHRDLRPELEVGAHGVAERLVVGHANGIQRGQVELDEPLPLLLSDLQVPVDVDQVPEAEFTVPGLAVQQELRDGLGTAVDAAGGAFTMSYTTVAATAARLASQRTGAWRGPRLPEVNTDPYNPKA